MIIKECGNEKIRVIEVGDKITAQGITFEVAEILSCNDYGGEDGIYCEFLDLQGKYHYWKEGCDGGKVISKK